MKTLKSKSIKKSQRGFTLIELIISMSMMTFLMLGGAYSLMKLFETSTVANEQISLKTDVSMLERLLPQYLGMAVNTRWTSNPIGNIAADQKGEILLDYDSGFDVATPQTVAIALFLRETGSPNIGNTFGNLKGTAFYFREPTVQTPGELLISTTGTAPGSSSTLSSGTAAFTFSNIVKLELTSTTPAVNNVAVRVVQIDITVRKFLSGNRNFWCPDDQLDVPACALVQGDSRTRSNYKDIDKVFYITLVNNNIIDDDMRAVGFDASGTNLQEDILVEESIYGSLYFFKSVLLWDNLRR